VSKIKKLKNLGTVVEGGLSIFRPFDPKFGFKGINLLARIYTFFNKEKNMGKFLFTDIHKVSTWV
jgi:hypothetical protein